MLDVRNLSVTYPGQNKPVFENVSFSLQAGDFLRLAGANGSGKTTLLYALCNVIPLEIDAIRVGEVRLSDKDMTSVPINQLIPDMLLAMHNPAWQLFFPTVQDEIVYALENLGLESGEIQSRLDRAVQTFNLTDMVKHNPAELSLGWQRLVLLAVMEAIQPKVLLLDEPLNNLSNANKVLVINWIRDYCHRGGSVIAAEHDQAISRLNPRTLLLPHGAVD
jgi:energy-coupling factor transporter ATP-binding protein EcfA2